MDRREANQDIAKRFLKASFKGWAFCRDNQDECLQHVLDSGPTLGEGHQRWQLNEINALTWPNATGIGVMDETALPADRGHRQAVRRDQAGVERLYRTDLAEAAVKELEDEGVDVNGADWEKETVESPRRRVTEGNREGDPQCPF